MMTLDQFIGTLIVCMAVNFVLGFIGGYLFAKPRTVKSKRIPANRDEAAFSRVLPR